MIKKIASAVSAILSPAPKLASAYWMTNNTAVVSLDRDWSDWANFWKLPPLALKSKREILSITRVPPVFWSAGSSYYIEENEVIFVLQQEIYRDYDLANPEMDIFVAGTFNNWMPNGRSDWKMTLSSFGSFKAWILHVPRERIFSADKPEEFKFVTGDGRWLEPPAGMYNLVDDGRGNRNLLLRAECSGRNAFRIVCKPTAGAPAVDEVVWTLPAKERHSIPLKTGYFLSLLFSPIPLGAIVARDGRSTTFRFFAPRARFVTVEVYKTDIENAVSLKLVPCGEGVWEGKTAGNLHGRHYDIFVDGSNADSTTAFDAKFPVLDPYAKACVSRKGPAIVVDDRTVTFATHRFTAPNLADLVIAEVHLRDLLARHPKYKNSKRPLGFRELADYVRSDDCYLKKLGVNAVELQPIQQFDAETREEYHWGYMPNNWFAPAAAYARDPAAGTQLEDFRDLVKAFHSEGFAVILDVVYNHVGEPNHLMHADKNYYFKLDFKGHFTNWSGCGNDYRADRPMARRLIVDSLLWMIRCYGVDGFRFDLAELIGVPALREIESAVRARYPECILIAEPWSFRGHIAGELRHTSFSSWNDGFRDYAAKFVYNNVNLDGFRYFISGSPDYFSGFPAQTINYTESHDDRCWLDKITECANHNAENPTPNDRRRTHIMFAFLLASLGTPMIAEGQDFLRTKHGKNNTYLDGKENALDYGRLERFAGTHAFVRDWIAFRLSPFGRLFRQRQNAKKGFFRFYPDQTNTAAVVFYNDDHSQGLLQYILAINPRLEPATVQIPRERFVNFRCIGNTDALDFGGVDEEAGFGFDENGRLKLPPISCHLFVNRD